MGEGSPTVILESGVYRNTGRWITMQPQIATVTRVCAYDRANITPSDPAPTPRTVQQLADDLHVLLKTAGVPGPYVLTALSFGALVSRMFASTYPEDVAGLVLVDPLSEDLEARWTAVLPPDLRERWLDDFWFGNPEGIAFEESYAQVRAARPLPTVPLIVIVHGDITHDDNLFPTGWPVEPLDTIWKELVAEQATLIPGGRLVVAAESGHRVEAEQPAVIVDAVMQVIMAARDPNNWASPVATPAS
jgi:pimeloyl-ACP methyl ester carboxylesterase